jgi:hypothetical protein
VFSIPAWRAVLGINGHRPTTRHANTIWQISASDSSDVSHTLARQQLQQKLHWRRNRIELAMPPTYEEFVRFMDDQWQFGHDRAEEALRTRVASIRPASAAPPHQQAATQCAQPGITGTTGASSARILPVHTSAPARQVACCSDMLVADAVACKRILGIDSTCRSTALADELVRNWPQRAPAPFPSRIFHPDW